MTAETPSWAKFVVLGLIVLAGIIGGIWYFSRSGTEQRPQPTATSPTTAKAESAPAGMVAIPGGTFMMGRDNAQDPEETPAHSVSVAPFYLDKTPVTAAEYAEFVPNPVIGDPNWPATLVSWNDAHAYCQGNGKRLPSEAEWEFAARGTDGRLYPWGNGFRASLANSLELGIGRPEPVAIRRGDASPFGVLDMSGNVWEWTADDYKPYPGRESTFQIPADAKVIRGGSYESDKDHVTTTTRNLDHATSRSAIIGFRCAKSQ